MEQHYNQFELKYYNTHPSVKGTAVCPIASITPGKIKRTRESSNEEPIASTSIVMKKDYDAHRIKPMFHVGTVEEIQETNMFEDGTFYIEVESIKLSRFCVNHLAQNYGPNCTIFLKWKFFNFNKTTTPYEYVNNVKGKIENFSITYRINLNFDLYKFLVYNILSIELHASNHYKQDIIGLGLCTLENCVDNIGKKMTYNVLIENKTHTTVFLKLKLNVQLECDPNFVLQTKAKCKDATYVDKVEKHTSEHLKQGISVNNENIIAYHEMLKTVLTKSNCLKISRSEISNELRERVQWLHQECNWKRTLQEHAILIGEDPYSVKTRQWRTKEIEKIQLRTYPKYIIIKPHEIVITVMTVRFLPNSFIMKDDNIKRIYVEYEFLSYKGIELETPNSLNKTDKVVFNFRKQFPMHIKKNSCDCKLLAEYIKTQKHIEFSIISEPIFRPQMPTLRCAKLAHCKINMLDLAECLDDVWNWKAELINNNNENDVVGTLLVRFEGLSHMRRTALTLLAPPGYDLIE